MPIDDPCRIMDVIVTLDVGLCQPDALYQPGLNSCADIACKPRDLCAGLIHQALTCAVDNRRQVPIAFVNRDVLVQPGADGGDFVRLANARS